MPRDLNTKIVDVGIEDDIRRNELRWAAQRLGMREDEIRARLYDVERPLAHYCMPCV